MWALGVGAGVWSPSSSYIALPSVLVCLPCGGHLGILSVKRDPVAALGAAALAAAALPFRLIMDCGAMVAMHGVGGICGGG